MTTQARKATGKAASKTAEEPEYFDLEELENLREQVQDLQGENSNLKEQLARIQREREEAQGNAEAMREEYFELLRSNRTHESTPPPEPVKKSTKIPDPEPLSDGKSSTFENWRTQIKGKFIANTDHFADEQAKMIYLFGRTTGDAQEHLQPRYGDDAIDQFKTAQEMLDHLATIYIDPHKVQNVRHDFRRLVMKSSQPFSEFHTKFMHLAGTAKIPADDWQPELYDKITIDL